MRWGRATGMVRTEISCGVYTSWCIHQHYECTSSRLSQKKIDVKEHVIVTNLEECAPERRVPESATDRLAPGHFAGKLYAVVVIYALVCQEAHAFARVVQ